MLNLKTVFLLIAVVSITSLSCSKNKEGDKLPDSIQQLINQDNFCICWSAVNMYKWKSKIIYHTSASASMICCTTPGYTSFYNEKGEPIHDFEWSSWEQFLNESELIKNIYTCEDGKYYHQ